MELIGATPVMSNVWGYRLYKETGLIVKFEGNLYSSIYDKCYYLRAIGDRTIDLVPAFPGAIQDNSDQAVMWMLNKDADEDAIRNYIHYLQKENREYEGMIRVQMTKTSLVIERLNKTLEDLKTRRMA